MSTTGTNQSTDKDENKSVVPAIGIEHLPKDVFLIIKNFLPAQSFYGKNSVNLVCKLWNTRINDDMLNQLKNRTFLEQMTFNQFLCFTQKFPNLREIVKTHKYQINDKAKPKKICRLIMTAERECLHLVDEVMKKAVVPYMPIMSGDAISAKQKTISVA